MYRTALRSLTARKRRLLASAWAVMLGVAFLAGTLVLGATLTGGVSEALRKAYAGTDALVRSTVEVGSGENAERRQVEQSLGSAIAALDGVVAVAPVIQGEGRIVGGDGDPIDRPGSAIAGNWIADGRLNPYELAEGRAPAAPGEVVIDVASAAEGDLAIGDRTVLRTPEPVEAEIVGLATFGGEVSQSPGSYAGFTTAFADEVLQRKSGRATALAVAAGRHITQAELARRLHEVLPAGVEAVTRAELTREMEAEIQGGDSEAVRQALLIFALVSLVVAMFTVYNTFSILVAQRARESALLRALGASRGQILRAVTAEAAVIGLAGSVAGIAAGIGLAAGLLALMDELGRNTPASAPVVAARAISIPLATGVIVTLAATLVPAVRASRVPPLAAMRDASVDQAATSAGRAAGGALLACAGAMLTVGGVIGEAPAATGAGAAATLVGVVALGPLAAWAAAALVGVPLAGSTMSGVLARRNVMRNPRRTANSAMALMIGVAVVSLFTVIAASFQQSIEDAVQAQFAGELVIAGEGRGGLSPELARAVARLPEVSEASPTGGVAVRVDGRNMLASTIDPPTIESVIDVGVRHGSLRDLAPDALAVSIAYAEQHGLALGDQVEVEYADGVAERRSVGAIFANDDLAIRGIALPRSAVLPHTSRPVDVTLLIDLGDGVTESEGEAAVQRVADRFDAPDVQTNQEFTDAIAAEIDVMLTVIYMLLIVAILIALMGITNTLSLSIHERTRELGLLRAVGQTRQQARAMVRGEALIVSVLGTVSGVGLGLFLGWAALSTLDLDGFAPSFSLPMIPLATTVALGALAGLLASAIPARRAARVDLLAAIATE